MTIVATICGVMLSIASFACLARLVGGPTLADRILALDALLITFAVAIGLWTAITGDATYVTVLLGIALVAFIGTVTVARFIERRGS